jgi:DNA-binding transcriptional LysR family regulator
MAGDLEEIEAFVAVVSASSFAGAATALGLSPSVVTRRVQALEARLAAQLLQRTTRRVTLTEAGQLFHERVAAIPARLAEAAEAVREAGKGVAGQLRVVMPSFFASSGFHHEVIPRFLAAHPEVHLTLEVVADPLAHLREDFDLLVAARAPGQRFPDTSLVRRRLLRFRRAVFASPAYLARHGTPARPAELTAHNCLSYPDRAWHFVDPDTRAPLTVRTRGTLTTNSNAMLFASVVGGIGIAYTTPYFFEAEEADGRVVRVLERYAKEAAQEIHLFHPEGRYRPRRTRAFADALAQHFRRLPLE